MWMIHLTLLNRTRRAELFIIINSVGCGEKAGMHACPEVGLKFRQLWKDTERIPSQRSEHKGQQRYSPNNTWLVMELH